MYIFQVVPRSGTDDLHMPATVRNIVHAVIKFEKCRACVFGSWASPHTQTTVQTQAYSSASDSGQKACIVGLAGPAGRELYAKSLSFHHLFCFEQGQERRLC
jgi:hypothetical protein